MNNSLIKYQIFVSSTYLDLIEERKEVIETILKMYHIPIGMEMFSADNKEQWQVIKKTIDSSDIYVLIIGHRYGSMTKKERISYTKKEFDYAKTLRRKNKLQMFCFIRERNIPISPDKVIETEEHRKKLEEFISEIRDEGGFTIEYWKDASDLGKKVGISLSKCFTSLSNEPGNIQGWVKRDLQQELYLKQLLQIKKAMHKVAIEQDSSNIDIETFTFDKSGNCQIVRVREQTFNTDVSHTFVQYISDEYGHASVEGVSDLNTGKNLTYMIYEHVEENFSFFIILDKFYKRGEVFKHRVKIKIQNYLSDLVKKGIGYIRYDAFRNTSFSNKKDVFIFPDIPLYQNLTLTLNNKSISFNISKGSKIFSIDYGVINSGQSLSVEFRLN